MLLQLWIKIPEQKWILITTEEQVLSWTFGLESMRGFNERWKVLNIINYTTATSY